MLTNLASKEYLFTFIAENREYIEYQCFFSKLLNNAPAESTVKKINRIILVVRGDCVT